MDNPLIRVLVVDDYEPLRQFICSMLGKIRHLRIVGESSDGLEAVHKAEELQPDLIVLDIGLPSLNGIEAARRIRKLCPESKILFVSQEASPDVVREAFALGALGYVVKANAGSDLLAAVGAVLAGRKFVSSGLSSVLLPAAPNSKTLETQITRIHNVEFYPDDAAFVVGFARFIEATLEAGNAVIVVATDSHRKRLFERLDEYGVDIFAAVEQGRYFSVDAADILSAFMVNGLPDPVRFFSVAGDLIAPAIRETSGESHAAICGECASMLWAQGNADAAIQVEQLCNQLAKRYGMDILCGFLLSDFYREEDKQIFEKIHSEF